MWMWSSHTKKMARLSLEWDWSFWVLSFISFGPIIDFSSGTHLPLWFPWSNCLAFFPSRCLKTPLDNISITNCLLTESDLTHLSWCPKICQLKGLNLSGITLTDFSPKLLQVLLEKVAGTLEELDLNLCGIMDVHLMAFLPALSHCSQLRVLSMCGNLISMAILEGLLRHNDRFPDLSLELYLAPRESYSSMGVLHLERLAQIKAELRAILTDLEHPRKIWVSPSPCPHCGDDMCGHLCPNT